MKHACARFDLCITYISSFTNTSTSIAKKNANNGQYVSIEAPKEVFS